MKPEFDRVAAATARLLEIDSIRFDANDSICLEFDGTPISLVAVDRRLVFHASLAQLSDFSDIPSLYRFLLVATAQIDCPDSNCCLAIDGEEKAVELCCTVAPLASINQDTLSTTITRFYEAIRYWQLQLNEFSMAQQPLDIAPRSLTSLV